MNLKLNKNIEFYLGDQIKSKDLEIQILTNGQFEVAIYFLKSLCDLELIRTCISEPLVKSQSPEEFANKLNSFISCNRIEDADQIQSKLLMGDVIIKFDGQLWILSAANSINKTPAEATIETSVQGPALALAENRSTSINLIRQRYSSSGLLVMERSVGKISQTKLSLLYDEQFVNKRVLQEVLQQIENVEADVVQSVGQLEALISNKKFRLFPNMLITERPDRIAINLATGKVIVLMEGTPFALIAPAVFFDFMSAMDDVYQTNIVSKTLVFLRYIALFISITLPALYIAIVSYNPEVFRIQLTISIAGSRAAVPYPSFIEVFIMLFLFEALVEASIRLPKSIGPTATTVGGLILGQAAQQAGLISSIMIIVTSTVAISNFVIPINAMSFAIRVVKYPLIILAIFFGITGVICGVYSFLLYLANMRSFGEPYFKLFVGEKSPTDFKKGDMA
jgi:spore germination protein KA